MRSKFLIRIVKKIPYKRTFKGIALSNSMAPLINQNEIVTIERVSPNSLKTNDIIAFYKNGNLYMHRILIINRHRAFVITKGDNLIFKDKPVKYKEIVGKAIFVNCGNKKLSLSNLFSKLFRFNIKTMFSPGNLFYDAVENIEFILKSFYKRTLFYFHTNDI